MTRVLRLTLLGPDIVEATLDGKHGSEVTLARMLEPFPVEWQEQGLNDKKGSLGAPRVNATKVSKPHLRNQGKEYKVHHIATKQLVEHA